MTPLTLSRGDVVLTCFPFTDLTGVSLRPAVVVSQGHIGQDIVLIAISSVVRGALAPTDSTIESTHPDTAGGAMSSADTQHWNPALYDRHARFVSDLGMPVVELLSPQPGERILDLGCGDGVLTIKLVELGCTLVGVDTSASMVEAARSLGLDAHVMDGHSLPFAGEFDAVFSNAALHWMPHPERVLAGVWRALKLGGRFVGEMGGAGNVASITTALTSALVARGIAATSPWFFPSPEAYSALLEASGFLLNTIDLIPRPTALPGDMGAWLETFAQPYTASLAADDRQALLAEVVAALRPTLCDAQGQWHADYVRLRFSARKPSKPLGTIFTH